MFKRILLLLISTSFIAPLSYADTVTKFSGEYTATGTHLDQNDINYQYYSHELDIAAELSIEETTLTTRFGIINETWGDENNTGNADMDFDRCWVTHVFPTGFKLEVGKMTGRDWGTMLGNDEDGYYRIRGTKANGNTQLSGYVQKNVENGETNHTSEHAERDDSDAISIGLIHKIGSVHLMPKITYSDDSSVQPVDRDTDGTQTIEAIFAVIGKIGSVEFESEMIFMDITSDYPTVTEYSLFNIWTDICIDFDSVRTGLSLAYGTEDEGQGQSSFGIDFTPMIIMDNDEGTVSNLGAMFFAKLYAKAEPFKGLHTGFAVAYGDYDEDVYNINPDPTTLPVYSDKTKIYEVNMTLKYEITKALSYSAGVAYADVEAFRDEIMQVEHELVFAF